MGERIMDSMDQERAGITIRAKNASVTYKGVKINIVDTPGHADFGGEVERTLCMVDGVLILVDAKEGPMPQTTFVLRKSVGPGHKAIVVVNKIDRPDAVIDDVVNRTFDLFVHLGASDEQLDFPLSTPRPSRGATLDLKQPGTDISPLLDTILDKIPAPAINRDSPFQLLVLALAQDSYKGKWESARFGRARLPGDKTWSPSRKTATRYRERFPILRCFRGLSAPISKRAEAGEIVALCGLEEVNIGDTIADPNNPSRCHGDDRRTNRPDDLFREQQPIRRPKGNISPHATFASGCSRSWKPTSPCASRKPTAPTDSR